VFEGPQAVLWVRAPEVEKAQGPQAVHHLVVHGEPTNLRFEAGS
jgi:hypothetical protein